MALLKGKELKDLNNNDVDGFVLAKGKKIVNGKGKEFLFRGVGLGSWFLPEGYMWCMPDKGDRPRKMEKMILDLVGEDKAELFWQSYFDSYITKDDIRLISEGGFNSLRLPISSRYLLQSKKSIERIDALIEWCREYNLYVILDLHGAPDGQTGTNIDDSENDHPDLFTNEANWDLTIEIWRSLALRYKDEWIVVGYDLLNEPLPDWFSKYNDKVMPLYRDIIQAIREVDDKHMIILEGVHWATDWSIFTETIDDNLMLQFHKYWNSPDGESLEPYVGKRNELNVPIFMGEGGENNADWYCGAFRLFEDFKISWNFWTWKKMDTDNSPFSINKPANWDLLIAYLNGGDKPDIEMSEIILWEFLENLKFSNCIYKPEIINSIMRIAPLRIPTIFYSNNRKLPGFRISNPIKGSSFGFRSGDGMTMGFSSGINNTLNFHHGKGEQWNEDEWMYVQLKTGDWVSYDFLVNENSENPNLSISLKIRSEKGEGHIKISVDSEEFEDYYESDDKWQLVKGSKAFKTRPGSKRIILLAEKGPVQIERVIIDTQ